MKITKETKMSKRVKEYLDELRDNNVDVDHKIFYLTEEQYENIYKLMALDDKELMKEPILTKPPKMDVQTRQCLIKRFNSISRELGYKSWIIEELEEDILRDTNTVLDLKNKLKLLIPEVVLYQKRLQDE